jgi:hypothetical protein
MTEYEKVENAATARHGPGNSGVDIETMQHWYHVRHGHKTWGWPIYRTHYACSPARWEFFQSKFRSLLLETMGDYFPAEEVAERSQYIEFPIWEDRERFEGATMAQLRAHYLEYRASNRPFEEQGLPTLTGQEREDFFADMYCRYRFFLVADAAAISSVVDAPGELPPWLDEKTPWINAVEVDWPPEESVDVERGHVLVEGSEAFDVGFHRAAVQTLYPAHWAAIDTFDSRYWYVRPPGIRWEEA